MLCQERLRRSHAFLHSGHSGLTRLVNKIARPRLTASSSSQGRGASGVLKRLGQGCLCTSQSSEGFRIQPCRSDLCQPGKGSSRGVGTSPGRWWPRFFLDSVTQALALAAKSSAIRGGSAFPIKRIATDGSSGHGYLSENPCKRLSSLTVSIRYIPDRVFTAPLLPEVRTGRPGDFPQITPPGCSRVPKPQGPICPST